MNADVVFEIANKPGVLAIPNAAVVNVQDAVAAGEVLGLDAQTVQTALRGRALPEGERLAMAEPGSTSDRDGAPEAGNERRPAERNGAGSETPAEPAGESSVDCQALLQRVREGGGFNSLPEADRAKMRACRQELGGQGGAEGGLAARQRGAAGGVRPAVVFVAAPGGAIEPRRIMLGVNDYDYSEVVEGLQEGERVVLMSVARLQAQQEQFTDRMRERAGSPLGTPGGGRR